MTKPFSGEVAVIGAYESPRHQPPGVHPSGYLLLCNRASRVLSRIGR